MYISTAVCGRKSERKRNPFIFVKKHFWQKSHPKQWYCIIGSVLHCQAVQAVDS